MDINRAAVQLHPPEAPLTAASLPRAPSSLSQRRPGDWFLLSWRVVPGCGPTSHSLTAPQLTSALCDGQTGLKSFRLCVPLQIRFLLWRVGPERGPAPPSLTAPQSTSALCDGQTGFTPFLYCGSMRSIVCARCPSRTRPCHVEYTRSPRSRPRPPARGALRRRRSGPPLRPRAAFCKVSDPSIQPGWPSL